MIMLMRSKRAGKRLFSIFAFRSFTLLLGLILFYIPKYSVYGQQATADDLIVRKTGGSTGGIENLKFEVRKISTVEREKPYQSLWFLLVENTTGERKLVIGFVPFKAKGGSGRSGGGPGIAKASSSAIEVSGKDVASFIVSPWPAMSSGSWSSGVHGIARFEGGWARYTLSGRPSKTKDVIIAWRMELWQNGHVVFYYDEPAKSLYSAKQIPSEWWIVGKYPDKINYKE